MLGCKARLSKDRPVRPSQPSHFPADWPLARPWHTGVPRQLPHSQHLINHRRCQQQRASNYPSTLPGVIAGYRHCNQTLSPSAQISQPHLPYWPSLPRATPCVVDVASSFARPALLPAASLTLRTALRRVVPDLRQHAVRRLGSSLSPSLSMHSVAFARAPRDSEVPSYLASCIRPPLATGPAHPVRGVLLQIDTSDSEAIGCRSTGTSACRKRISRPSLRRSFVHHQPNQESVQSFGAHLDGYRCARKSCRIRRPPSRVNSTSGTKILIEVTQIGDHPDG